MTQHSFTSRCNTQARDYTSFPISFAGLLILAALTAGLAALPLIAIAGEPRLNLDPSREWIKAQDDLTTSPGAFKLVSSSSSRPVRTSEDDEPTKKFLYIRTDFSDFQGSPLTGDHLHALVNGPVAAWIEDFSGDREKFQGDVMANVVRASKPLKHYQEGDFTQELIQESIALAAAAGAPVGLYDGHVICITNVVMEESEWIWAGLAGLNTQIIRDFDPHVLVHETIHNFGPGHSSSLETYDSNIISTNSMLLEYGSPWDVMGSGRNGTSFPNPILLEKAGWIAPEEIVEAKLDGVYRVFPFDSYLPGQTRSLVVKGGELPVWVGFRSLISEDPYLPRGPLLYQQPNATRSILLDTHPDSPAGVGDAPLDFGRTFADPDGQYWITPMAPGTDAESGNSFIDLTVKFQDENQPSDPPVGAVDVPAKIQARKFKTFSFDPAPDSTPAEIVRWVFDDEFSSRTGDAIQKAWLSSGNFSFAAEANGLFGNISTNKFDLIVEDFLDNFQTVDPLTDRTFMDVEFGHDLFVAAGERIRTSSNGTDFDQEFGGGFFPDIDFDGSIFVAAGQLFDFDNNKWGYGVVVSEDGNQWDRVFLNDVRFDSSSERLAQIEKFGEQWVAISFSGEVWTSPDARTWTKSGDMNPIFRIEQMTSAFDKLWAISTGGVLGKSSDGITWEIIHNDPEFTFTSIASGGNTILAMGADNALISEDSGQTFQKILPLGEGREGELRGVGHIRYLDGIFVGIHTDFLGNNHFQYLASIDGKKWDFVGKPLESRIRGFAASEAGYLAVGDTGAAFFSALPSTLEPLTFSSWIQSNIPQPLDPSDLLPGSDPDADGFSNLLEYVHGSLPADPDSSPSVQQTLTSDSQGLTFAYSINPQVNDSSLQILVSSDLKSWTSPDPQDIHISQNPISESRTDITYTISQPNHDSWFIQLTYPIPPQN